MGVFAVIAACKHLSLKKKKPFPAPSYSPVLSSELSDQKNKKVEGGCTGCSAAEESLYNLQNNTVLPWPHPVSRTWNVTKFQLEH